MVNEWTLLSEKNENKHEQKNQRVKAAGAGPEREKGAGMGEGQWVRTPSVMHVTRLCFLLTYYFENEL